MDTYELSEETIFTISQEDKVKAEEIKKELRQHNALTNSRYEMKANEMDIFCQLLSILQPDDKIGTKYLIPIKDLEMASGKELNYSQVKSTVRTMMNKKYEIEENGTWSISNWFSHAKYFTKQGVLEIAISESIRPLLINVKSNFTSFKLKTVFQLKSKYAKRIYQMVCQWKDIGEFTITISDLKIKLYLKDPENKLPEQYADYGVFDANVLSLAKQQINENTDFKLDYSPIKKGRKVHAVRFTFNANRLEQLKLDLDINSPYNEIEQSLVEQLNKLGIVKKDIIEKIILKKDLAFKWLYKFKLGQIKPKSPSGHLLKSLEIL